MRVRIPSNDYILSACFENFVGKQVACFKQKAFSLMKIMRVFIIWK